MFGYDYIFKAISIILILSYKLWLPLSYILSKIYNEFNISIFYINIYKISFIY